MIWFSSYLQWNRNRLWTHSTWPHLLELSLSMLEQLPCFIYMRTSDPGDLYVQPLQSQFFLMCLFAFLPEFDPVFRWCTDSKGISTPSKVNTFVYFGFIFICKNYYISPSYITTVLWFPHSGSFRTINRFSLLAAMFLSTIRYYMS